MAIGGLSSSRKLLARRRLQKRSSARRILMETLESRQLMAVGPQLLGIQPNSGDLLDNGEILHVSPREFKLRFDDAAGIDPATLGGIRFVRSGDDGVFERASNETDFGTNGQTLVGFYAQQVGEAGNGIAVKFTKASRTDNRAPIVTNNGREVTIQLNSNPGLETRVDDLVQALDPGKTTSATTLIYALRLRGSQTVGITTTVDTVRPLVLGGANSVKVTTSFGQSSALQVRLTAVESGNAGLGISVVVTGRDRGGAGLPIISATGKTINVEINTNPRFATTVQEFVDALNSNSLSNGLIQATFNSGSGSTRLGSLPITYSPLLLTGVVDVEIIPAYVGLGDSTREVIVRFAEALPDDKYRIEIVGQGTRALRNINGQAYNQGVTSAVSFELDLGAQIESIVPQPVVRNSSGQLVQQRNQIEVYFNNDDLIDTVAVSTVNGVSLTALKSLRSPLYFQNGDSIVFTQGSAGSSSVVNPTFYRLIHTAGSLNNTDDATILPNSVRYYPDSDRVTLGFSRNLDQLLHPVTGAALPVAELRLRVGNDAPLALPPVALSTAADPGDTFAGATNLSGTWTPGAAGSQSIVIDSTIANTTPYNLDFPGAVDDPGNRQIRLQSLLRLAGDTVNGTSVIFYNFQGQLGTSAFNNTIQLNAITEQQKQRVREVFTLYEQYLGVRFVESSNRGLTVAVGDTRAVTPFEDILGSGISGIVGLNGPGFNVYESGVLSNGQLATVLDTQDFSDSTVNGFGGPFMRGAMQGIGRLIGLGLSDEVAQLTIQSFNAVFAPGVGTEIVLPGDADIIHGQYLYRPDSKDIDLYQFSVPVSGRVSIETFAERMSQASLLDSQIRLFQRTTAGGWEEIAANDDYNSSDSYIELELGKGNYIVGVSSSGNGTYDPTIADSGLGGRSQGNYQLRMDFRVPANSGLKDSTGTAFDGDADGIPGGVQDFWFRPSGPSNTKFVDKSAASNGNGSIGTPYKNIKDALAAAASGDAVRIVGNGGTDGKLSTAADNLAYEIGFDTLGRALPDGSTFDVPKNVSVVIDSGAVLKLRRARIGVGSTSVNVDRSAGTLLVLGTPLLLDAAGAVIRDAAGAVVPGSVYLTSLNDGTVGKNSSQSLATTTPSSGDWGGIDFRNRTDASAPARKNLEAQGLFLNTVNHADIRYGGGQVVVNGVSQVVTPIQMFDARPTVSFSQITGSADAAMSATPNSFLDSNFHTPAEQGAASFTSDYNRVGPEIHGNQLAKNSLNGLQIRIRTGSGSELEKLTVQGRFDDTDIVHIIPENFEIAGTVGGALQKVSAPSSALVTVVEQANGALAAGIYNYRFSGIDAIGVESPASEPTVSASTFGASSVVLRNLPQGVRNIYRSTTTELDPFGFLVGASPYELIATLPVSSSTFIDNGTSLGTLLSDAIPEVVSRLDARLKIDAGTVVKSQGSRIEVSLGGQLIAEGDLGMPVVFTSLVDARYGAGGTFDTANRVGSQTAVAGDWGGIYVGHTSKASLDHAVVAFGGGTTRIEGGFADFNALETHQSEVRIANSRFEFNGSGAATTTDTDRSGRGSNSEGTVFIRGSQPIIVDNIFKSNGSAAISANVSALNSAYVNDTGRSTGAIDRAVKTIGNQGPLIQGNLLDDNFYNGMVVRGGQLTTAGVWDDTEIVHIVLDEIIVPDFHEYGGLRMESSPTESLVVKLKSGANSPAGFTATGTPLDNTNRIGGSVQIIGTPGQPVVLTSLFDCNVGAGFTLGGAAQNDTNNSGLCDRVAVVPTAPFADVIVLMDESLTMFQSQQFSVGMIADLDAALLQAGIGTSTVNPNRYGLVGFADANSIPRSVPVGGQLFGTAAQYGAAVSTLSVDGFTEDGYLATKFALDNYPIRTNAKKFIILISDEDRDILDANLTFSTTLGDLRAEGANLEAIVSTNIVDQNFGSALAINANNTVFKPDGSGGFTTSPNGQIISSFGTTVTDYADLVFQTGGIVGDISQISLGGNTAKSFSSAMVSSIVLQAVPGSSLAAPGDWRSVLLDTHSNDRNVAGVTENETASAISATANETPSSAQYLGRLAPNSSAGDENQRLGFQIQGVIGQRGDVDVYSFNANAGTEVWFDIDRTANSLDTVIELVDADGRTLALSDDSLSEEATPSLLYSAAELGQQKVHSLRKSSLEFYQKSVLGTAKDLYSTNPRDAGLRVVLPGAAGSNNLYHVRVRSSNLAVGDAASQLLDSSKLHAGLTLGNYQLELRLQEVDEVPGSGITYADIRFATNGLQLVGVPGNSPLLGENSEAVAANDPLSTSNNTINNAQVLGNLLTSNRQAISVGGNLETFTDVDWFSFTIDHQKVTPTGLRQYFATILDVDYGDGIGRPDMSAYIFDSAGNLILAGLGSNLVDDQASLVGGSGSGDLSRGSSGGLDPYIGAYELPGGAYFVAITNSQMVPSVLATYTAANAPAATAAVRLQPVEGVRLIAEDHVNSQGGSGFDNPITPVLFPSAGSFDPVNGIFYNAANDSIVDYGLGDIVLYVSQDVGTELTNIYTVNPFTGESRGQLGRVPRDLGDIAFRDNGQLRAFDRALERRNAANNQDTEIEYVNIDPGTGASVFSAAGMATNHLEFNAGTPSAVPSNDGFNPEAITFAILNGEERGFFVANRPTPTVASQPTGFAVPGYSVIPGLNDIGFDWNTFFRQNPGTTRPGPSYFSNVLYEFDENTGVPTSAPAADKTNLAVALGAGTAVRERGYIETLPVDPITGVVNVNQLSTLLVAREVTTSNPNSGAISNIQDGDTLQLLDSVNFPLKLEFNLGPEVKVNYDPAAGLFVRDGMKFSLDGTTYEFDTGSIVLVNAFNGNQLADGSTVRIRNLSGIERIFEFDNNNVINGAGNIRVRFAASNTQSQLANSLATAITSSPGFGVVASVANSNRISLVNASATVPVLVTGVGLGVTGSPGVTIGNIRIPISETASLRDFVLTIDQFVGAGVTVSYESGRMNFSGANIGSFTDLEAAGIFTAVGSTGGTAGGSIPINVLVSDSAETVAARIAQAINAAGIPGLGAALSGVQVQLSGGTIVSSGSIISAGVAPGGIVRGIAIIGNSMYAVSDEGGLYRVQSPTSLRTGNVGDFLEESYELLGISFTGLVAGPSHVTGTTPDGTPYSQLLFGIDNQGRLHAFNTQGKLQPVFANGATSIDTGLSSATGLALSTLDFNLWHVTGREPVNNGNTQHGLPPTTNDTRIRTTGGSSLYFGYENPGLNGNSVTSGLNDLTGLGAPAANLNYNFPGGAAGAIESAPFSLNGLGAADLPTLYFNYFFETEGAGSAFPRPTNVDDYMRDSLRVYISGDDGQWTLVATNNSDRTVSLDEFDAQVNNPLGQVQELFDDNGRWRQARIPLDSLAGQENVKVRIEFASAGGFGYGLQGGRGPELRTIAGNKLVDGTTLSIHGETFEIEMGASVTLPSGGALSNGDSVTIDGTRYVFTDGSGIPPASPDIAVQFTKTQTAEQVATALRTAILTATTVRPIFTGLNFSNEGNDVISVASQSGANGDTMRISGSGFIGDNPANLVAAQDVDMIRLDLGAGATVSASIEATLIGSPLDSFLRVFDSEGRALTNAFGAPIQNDNRPGSVDSLLTFTAPADGIYYIGVSSSGNQTYNPTVAVGNAASGTGNYNLVIDVTRKLNPIQDENRLQLVGARNVVTPTGSAILQQGASGSTGIPINVSVSMTAEQVAQATRTSIAGFFANGAANVYAIRSGNTLDLTGLVQYDSFDFLTGQATPSLSELDSGPFGATTTFEGDLFSAFGTGTNFDGTTNTANPGTLGGRNNANGGVYLDDFIIGTAGRGEMVLDAVGGNASFIVDPQLSVPVPTRPNPEVLIGPYQFEIRGGDGYGIPLIDVPPVRLLITDSIESDERLAPGISIRFNSAALMIAGDTFTISDGTTQLTFEMDDVNDGKSVANGNIAVPFNTAALDGSTGARRSETAAEIAGRVREIINSSAVQSQLKLSANLLNNDRTSDTSSTVVLIGQPSVNVPTSIGTTIVSQGVGTSNRERLQGQIVINATRVTRSEGFGATISSSARQTSTDPLLNTQTVVPGSPRNTITLNTERLAPGAVIMNSEFLFNRLGGISVQGEIGTAGLPSAAVPFVRLVNNSIVGGKVSAIAFFEPKVYGGQFYDIGDLAFADNVASYLPLLAGGPAPLAGLDNRNAAVGVPNFSGTGEPLVNEGVVSLGRGGQIVLQFTNNLLTGSGNANPDLMVFEVGDSEEVLVEVSADGSRYTSVGRASAASPTIDIDAFGFNSNSRFAYVRLTDVINQGSASGDSVGADIDAVGAISSVAADTYLPGGQGITVTNNATATLLNNVIVNSATGINVDASSSSTVIGGTTFQRNISNVGGNATLGQFSNVVNNNLPLFINVSGGNLYPAASSPIIDSSIDSLEDRPNLVAVKQPLGIAASPILAPEYDVNGQLRVDDPSVETPFGLGENVFKDRGAQDRADFNGPSVILVQPIDNDVLGIDTNPEPTVVELTGQTLKYFDIQLFDGIQPSDPGAGSTVDPASVKSSSVLVYRDGVPLAEGVDYTFGFNATSGVIRLQPLAGIWRSESVYTIRFINKNESSVVAKAGADYLDGAAFQIIDARGSLTTFEFDLGYLVTVPSINGIDANVTDGTTFTIDDGTRRFTFEFDNNSSTTAGNRVITFAENPTPESVATAIAAAISATSLTVTTSDLGDGRIQIQGSQNVSLDPNDSSLIVIGQPGVRSVFGLQIPLQAGVPAGVTDGQTFVIDRSGAPVTFELDTDGSVLVGNTPVRFVAGASATQIGDALVTAINGAGLGLSPAYIGNGLVRLGGDANTRLTLTSTVLTQQGIPGLPAAVSIPISALATNSADDVAALIEKTIDNANLSGVTTTRFGARVVIEGARGIAGSGVDSIGAIRDFAGNLLKSNQVDGSTTLTIFLGEGLDYGDAPEPKYVSLAENNGPRHTVVNGLSLGVTVSPDADAKLPNADNDDGVTFTQLYSAFNTSFTVTVTNTTGATAYLSYWFDYDSDGIFETTEGTQTVSLLQFAIPASAGVVTLPAFTTLVPASAVAGTTYVRFRLSTNRDAVANPTGAAPDGEVEDYAITILPNPYKNPSNISSVIDAFGNNLDVNADGFVSPIDALQVINYLNNPAKPRQLTLPVNQLLPPYVDVNGDGVVSPLDALLVINFLNATRAGAGEGETDGNAAALELGAGEGVVLSSDWAAGLENIVMGKRTDDKPDSEPVMVTSDAALLSTQEDDDSVIDFQVQRNLNVDVLDDLLSQTGALDVTPAMSHRGGSIRDQLLASFFRK